LSAPGTSACLAPGHGARGHGYGTNGVSAQLVERAVKRGGVQLAVSVDAERGEGGHVARHRRRRGAAVCADPEAPDRAGAVVAVEVPPARRLHRRAAINVAAGDRAAVRVRVDEHRLHLAAGLRVAVLSRVDGIALVATPAEVRELVEP